MKLSLLIGASLLALSTGLYAQAPQPDPSAQKQERREKMRAAHEKARQACESKAEGERRDCIRRELCAQSKDPAKCEARAKERAEKRSKMREHRREQHEKK